MCVCVCLCVLYDVGVCCFVIFEKSFNYGKSVIPVTGAERFFEFAVVLLCWFVMVRRLRVERVE